jgi:hypothetical protein
MVMALGACAMVKAIVETFFTMDAFSRDSGGITAIDARLAATCAGGRLGVGLV